MMFDNYGLIVMEQTGAPGSLGDSCAETFRYLHLNQVITHYRVQELVNKVTTPMGYIRHPDSPWREDDFSGDQALPLYLSMTYYDLSVSRRQFEARLRDNGWKLGNGDFASFQLWAVMKRANNQANWISDLPILFQALALRFFPYRWSESKKAFESTSGSSSDWLNHYHTLLQAKRHMPTWVSKLAARVTNKPRIMEKIKAYYASEPSHTWLIQAYESTEDL